MRKHSNAFRTFFSSYRYLAQTYIPTRRNVSPRAERELELTRAFMILFHAELEDYFESVCKAMLDESLDQFRKNTFTLVAVGLIAYFRGEDYTAGSSIVVVKGKPPRSIEGRLKGGMENHYKKVANNHGISQSYLADLFVPLGLTMQGIDPAWVAELQNLADSRGDFAHNSRTSSNGKPGMDPNVAYATARKVIFGAGGGAVGASISSLIEFDTWTLLASSRSFNPAVHRKRFHGLRHRLAWWLISKL